MNALLYSVPDFAVVGEATTGEEVVALAAELSPDVILMDLQMPGTNGIEATRRVLRESSDVRVLVVTPLEDEDEVVRAGRGPRRGDL